MRCIELHTYKEGGGLFLPSHRDNDSVLTLSARVSEDGAFGGGRFVTYDRGAPVARSPRPGVRRALPSASSTTSRKWNAGRAVPVIEPGEEGDTNGVDRFK